MLFRSLETGALRATADQGLVLRFVRERELLPLYRTLAAAGLAATPEPAVRGLVSCAGAATCRPGICNSRGLARAIADEVSRAPLALDGATGVRIGVSGCPNACGRHPAAAIGLVGGARRVAGRLVPHYVLQLGGRLGEARVRLARGATSLPARRVPAVLADLLAAFRASPAFPDFDAYLDQGGVDDAAAIADRAATGDPRPDEHSDWGTDAPFSLAGRGPGECGAGVFDLIEVDLASARDALAAGRRRTAVVLAARALLVTRGHDVRDEAEALRLFEEELVQPGHVAPAPGDLARRAAESASDAAFDAPPEEVRALIDAVQHLYDTMDDSLRLLAPAAAPDDGARPRREEPAAPGGPRSTAREADLRAVLCPLNYVKTKLLLQRLAPGALLTVLVSERGGRTVPESVRQDGDEIVSVEPVDGGARVTIRRQAEPRAVAEAVHGG